MARLPRVYGDYGFMHLTVRGIGKQILFEEDMDYLYYLNLLRRFSNETKVTVCAYCLMENHVHLLVCDAEHNTPLFMKKIGVSYAYYYNKKYDRTGHLFQDRYGSAVIESESYLLTVFRYILNNPRDAGICPASEYRWSSYRFYGNPRSFVDTKILTELLGDHQAYEDFITEKYEDDPLGPEKIRHDDEWAKSVIHKTLNVDSGTVLQSYDLKQRNEALRLLKEKGLTIRQIERLTRISKSIAQRA